MTARERGCAWAAGGLVTLLALAGVWSVDYLPTHDGPQHIFTVHAASRLDDATTGYGRFLEPGRPLTNRGFALVFGPFDRFLPWRTATRLALTALVLTWCAGALLLARSIHPERLWLGVALAAGAFQWSLYMGLFSFHLATGLSLLTLALALERPPRSHALHAGPARAARLARAARVARAPLLSGLLLLVALCHLVPAILCGAALVALEIARAPRDARMRALLRVALVGAPAATLAAAVLSTGLGGFEAANAGDTATWSPQRAPLWTLGRCFLAGPLWRAWPLTVVAVSAPLAWLALGRPRAEDRALLAAGAALLLAAALAPLHLRGWDFFAVRFVPLGVSCLLLAWPLERLRGAARGAAVGALGGFALASSLWAIDYNRELAERATDALAGLDAGLVRNGPRLPIVLDPYLGRPLDDARAPVPYAVPLLNLGQLYATAQGGFAPFTFAHSRWLHPVVWRDEARRSFPHVVDRRYAIDLAKPGLRDDMQLRAAVATYLAGIGTHYQDVVLWGRPEDAERLLGLGFVAEYRRGGLMLARFRGCPLTIRFPGDALPPEGTRIELGWLPAWHVTHRYRVDRRFLNDSGDLALPLENPPCGGAWLRLASDGRALRCEGADAEGRLIVPSTRATPVVECRPVPGAA